MAHDVKNLLSGVECVLILTLRESCTLKPNIRTLLEDARTNCHTINEMIQTSLKGKQNNGKVAVGQSAAVNIACVVAKCVRLLKSLAEERGISFRVSLADELPPLVTDEGRLTTTMINLLHNALKFSPCGKQVDIDVNVAGISRDRLVISVTDQGAGVSSAQFERIMSATCYDSRPKLALRSNGAGLSFCHTNVQTLGGEFWLESPPKGSTKGSRFCFSLPTSMPEVL
ncbi:MAG TPA: HAMP domain-containing sensor histidine kinase [Pyrinomonadaceae bacterium]|nr:HAMP domain-containing sensor histidine kinase [Pyrinomonadaceae bacterium]